MDFIVENDAFFWYKTFFPKTALRHHSAKGFPNLYKQILEYLASRYDTDKYVILDPMCGIGTTNIISHIVGYRSIGIELEYLFYRDMIGYDGDVYVFDEVKKVHNLGSIEHYAKNIVGLFDNDVIAIETTWWSNYYINDDSDPFISIGCYNSCKSDMPLVVAENIPNTYNLTAPKIVVTSPPYMRTSEHDQKQIDSAPEEVRHKIKPMAYQSKQNLSFTNSKRFYIDQLTKIYCNCVKLGAEVFVIVTRDYISDGKVVPLWEYNKEAMNKLGFVLTERRKAKLPFLTFFKHINYKNFHEKRGLPSIDYEDVCFYSV